MIVANRLVIRRFLWHPLFWAVVLVFSGCTDPVPQRPGFVRQTEWVGQGVWLKADTHLHSQFSDGDHSVSEIAAKAVEHGCDVIAVTDHADRDRTAATPEYAEAIEVARRTHPQLTVLAGLEWNVPPFAGEEHVAVLVPPSPQEYLHLAEFKAQFDDLGRNEGSAGLAGRAFGWLSDMPWPHGTAPVLIYNHPGRKAAGEHAALENFAQWRMACGLVVGFEGAPGHQKGAEIGSYAGPVKLRDRWDPAVAEADGSVDQLLRRGIDVWGAIATSDFHSPANDYWPGEFAETWIYAPERSGVGVLRALRAGSFVGVHGHIAREIELTAEVAGLERPAVAGEVIRTLPGSRLEIRLSAIVPERDWTGGSNQLDVIELIVVEPERSRIVELVPSKPRGHVVAASTIDVPRGGLVIRARGRRKVENGPDLMFYTNSIRVLTGDSPSSVGGLSMLPIDSRQMRPAFGVGLAILTAASLFWTVVGPARTAGWISAASGKVRLEAAEAPPRAGHYATAGMLLLLVAVYGSLVPLEFRPLALDAAIERFCELPWLNLGIEKRADWVANILLFVPLGFCGLASLEVDRPRSFATALRTTLVVVALAMLSLAVEFTQLWFPPRTTSQNDLVAETLGGLIGAGFWLLCGQAVTHWLRTCVASRERHSQLQWMLQAYLLGLLVYSVMPLDLTINPAELFRKYDEGKVVLLPVFRRQQILNYVLDTAAFIPVGVLAATAWLKPGSLARAWWHSGAIVLTIAVAIECLQLLVYSRFTASTDLITASLGGMIGGLAIRAWRRERGRSQPPSSQTPGRIWVWPLLAIAYAAVLGCAFWWPFELESDRQLIQERLDGFFSVPFAAMYWGSEFKALTQIMRKVLVFAPLGAILAHWLTVLPLPPTIQRIGLSLAFAGCAAFATIIELVQAAQPAHVCDVTDTLLYTAGAGLGGLTVLRLSNASAAPVHSNFVLVSSPSPHQNVQRRPGPVGRWAVLAIVGLGAAIWFGWQAVPRTYLPASPSSPDRPAAERSAAERAGTVFAAAGDLDRPPRIEQIPIPHFTGAAAVWGATGRDDRGHIWFGVSAADVAIPSAHLFEYIPELGTMADRGDVVSELKRDGIYRPGEGQKKIHSKIIQADDGHLYFTSMDEAGEENDGSRLPTWGSHLWRLRLTDNSWEHLAAVPEGLIALGSSGRWVYALGYFDHVVYQYDTKNGTLHSVRVGARGGFTSRNLLTDTRGHVYVPRVELREAPAADEELTSRAASAGLAARLVELDTELNLVAETPIEHYFSGVDWTEHGITGIASLADGTQLFTTCVGQLHRIRPPADGGGAAIVESLGWVHPAGTCYAPSLFALDGRRYVAGICRRKSQPFEWYVFDLESRETQIHALPVTEDYSFGDLVLYGSLTRDNGGDCYIVGRHESEQGEFPLLMRLRLPSQNDSHN